MAFRRPPEQINLINSLRSRNCGRGERREKSDRHLSAGMDVVAEFESSAIRS